MPRFTCRMLLVVLVGGLPTAHSEDAEYKWDLPNGFPKPRVPADNPMSVAKVRLGRHLFYDKRLSVNGTTSCATCHRQELAFTDGRAKAIGATGQTHPRSAMSLVNVAFSAALTWSNPQLRLLEKQATGPMFAVDPVEMGLLGQETKALRDLRADPVYRELFPSVFPGQEDPFTIVNVARAMAAFERTIISARSPYDRYYFAGERDAISDSARRGETIFFGDPLAGCYQCHGGFNFSDMTDHEERPSPPAQFHNTGLYNLAGKFSYPGPNLGLYEHTKSPADVGKFKSPSLRNIELTAPYMHDGSIATLEEAIDHYAAGGRTIASGPYAGQGYANPNKDRQVAKFALTPQNRKDLLAFLLSLTDREIVRDPRFSDPW